MEARSEKKGLKRKANGANTDVVGPLRKKKQGPKRKEVQVPKKQEEKPYDDEEGYDSAESELEDTLANEAAGDVEAVDEDGDAVSPIGSDGEQETFEPISSNADIIPLSKSQKRRQNKKVAAAAAADVQKDVDDSAVVFLSRIPFGFFEEQMRKFFSQFGDVKNLRLSRNKRTGRSKHYAFLEFDSSDVASIVVETMNNYFLYGKRLKCAKVPLSRVHPQLWQGANRKFQRIPWRSIYRSKFNKEKTPEQQESRIKSLVKKESKKRKKLEALGFDYDFPGFAAQAEKALEVVRSLKESASSSNNEDKEEKKEESEKEEAEKEEGEKEEAGRKKTQKLKIQNGEEKEKQKEKESKKEGKKEKKVEVGKSHNKDVAASANGEKSVKKRKKEESEEQEEVALPPKPLQEPAKNEKKGVKRAVEEISAPVKEAKVATSKKQKKEHTTVQVSHETKEKAREKEKEKEKEREKGNKQEQKKEKEEKKEEGKKVKVPVKAQGGKKAEKIKEQQKVAVNKLHKK